jgi:hypothetical protein
LSKELSGPARERKSGGVFVAPWRLAYQHQASVSWAKTEHDLVASLRQAAGSAALRPRGYLLEIFHLSNDYLNWVRCETPNLTRKVGKRATLQVQASEAGTGNRQDLHIGAETKRRS